MQAFDFETCLIQPGLPAPPPVCLSLCTAGGAPDLVPSSNGWEYMRRALARLIDDPLIVGFNVPFDLGVWLQWFPEHIRPIFDALEADRIVDVQVAERLREISAGTPARYDSLATLAARYGVAQLDKENSPRTDYARLLHAELSQYPPEHVHYAKEDADVTIRSWLRVRERSPRVSLAAVASETRSALWLHLCASAGIRTNADNVEELRRNALEAVEMLRDNVLEYGFIRPNGSKDTKIIKAKVLEAYGSAPPLTKTGQALVKAGRPWELKHVSTSKVALNDSGDPLLEEFAKYGEWSAVLNKDIDMLLGGVCDPIHTRYGCADTTRTTSSGPNVQNFRRLEGVRECVVPRDGHCFGQIDVGGLELGTLAQVIVWKLDAWGMANLINEGIDLHLHAACRLAGWEYEKAKHALKVLEDKEVKQLRQFCKIANFGYPGFMGAATLVPYARQQGERITLEQANDLKANWKRTLPDAAAYLNWVKGCRNWKTGRYDFVIPGSPDILRAGATIASCANGHFQGLGAQAMKRAGWEIMKEIWTVPSSPLYGIRMVLFIHDECIFEIPIGKQHAVMMRAKEILESSLRRTIPDVKLFAEPCAMPFWTKDAAPVYNQKKELEIWQPKAS